MRQKEGRLLQAIQRSYEDGSRWGKLLRNDLEAIGMDLQKFIQKAAKKMFIGVIKKKVRAASLKRVRELLRLREEERQRQKAEADGGSTSSSESSSSSDANSTSSSSDTSMFASVGP